MARPFYDIDHSNADDRTESTADGRDTNYHWDDRETCTDDRDSESDTDGDASYGTIVTLGEFHVRAFSELEPAKYT